VALAAALVLWFLAPPGAAAEERLDPERIEPAALPIVAGNSDVGLQTRACTDPCAGSMQRSR
jgi:hypothetical protein